MRLKHRLACMAAAALCTISTSVTAGIVQVGVRTFAGDFPAGLPYVVSTDGSLACCLTTASRTVTATAGSATATSMAEANSLNGTLKERISANVAANRYLVGRNSGGSASANMRGSINLAGPVPGLATFMAVLEGTYDIVTPAPFNFQSLDNSIRMQHIFSIGSATANSPAFSFSVCANKLLPSNKSVATTIEIFFILPYLKLCCKDGKMKKISIVVATLLLLGSNLFAQTENEKTEIGRAHV